MVECLRNLRAIIGEESINTVKEKCFSSTLQVIEDSEKEKANVTFYNQHFKDISDSIDRVRFHCDSDKNYFGDRGESKTKDKNMEELQKSSFQYTIKKKLNERKLRLSQLREELAQFDEIENKILEKRNEIKDLENKLAITEYSVRLLLREKRKMLEKVDEFNKTEEDMKRCEVALVCNGMEFDVNGP